MPIDLGDYTPVSDRIALFRSRYPHGSLQPVDLARPYWVEAIGDQTFIVYAAAAYRTVGDAQPGIGLAWEPFPGKTNYTRDSELQNAETSAWGRAIVAVLAADVHGGVATRDDVERRSRDADIVYAEATPQSPPPAGFASWPECGQAHDEASKLIKALPDEIDREPFQVFRAQHGWPMPAVRLAELMTFAEEAVEGWAARAEPRPLDEPTVQEPTAPEDPPPAPLPDEDFCSYEWSTPMACVETSLAHVCERPQGDHDEMHECLCGESLVAVSV